MIPGLSATASGDLPISGGLFGGRASGSGDMRDYTPWIIAAVVVVGAMLWAR